jgi:hypothetical protein
MVTHPPLDASASGADSQRSVAPAGLEALPPTYTATRESSPPEPVPNDTESNTMPAVAGMTNVMARTFPKLPAPAPIVVFPMFGMA